MMAIDSKMILSRLMAAETLASTEIEALFEALMSGTLEPSQAAGILVALRMKGETGAELAAAARVMRKHSLEVTIANLDAAVDTCGTGGDGSGSINVSTAAALVVAAAGVPVAKHGNRSVSSRCGSADVLEKLGVRLDLTPQAMAQMVDEVGIGFLFAPKLHPAMAAVMPIRRSLKVRTTFNLLGPLTNPAGVRRQVLGCWSTDLVPLMAGALAQLGAKHALVVSSEDGQDEISVCAPTIAWEIRDGEIVDKLRLEPAELGVGKVDPGELLGGDIDVNATRLHAILSGVERSAASEAVALNAGATLYVAGRVASIYEGAEKARGLIADAAAIPVLEFLAMRSHELAS